MSNLKQKKEDIFHKLSLIREDLLKSTNNLSIEKLNQEISLKEGSWTVLETIKHLYDSEDSMTRLMTGILEGSEGVPENFDLNRWNRRIVEKMSDKTLERILYDLKESRKRLIDFITGLEEADFSKKGRHGSLKIMTIEEIINLIGDHEKSHLEKIKGII